MNLFKNIMGITFLISLLTLVMSLATAGVSSIGDAYDRQQASEKAMIDEHKLYLASGDDDFYVTDPMNGFDEEVYEASEQYKTARHANGFIAKAYGRE